MLFHNDFHNMIKWQKLLEQIDSWHSKTSNVFHFDSLTFIKKKQKNKRKTA